MKSTPKTSAIAESAGRLELTAGADFKEPRRRIGGLRHFFTAATAVLSAAAVPVPAPVPAPAAKPATADVGNLALSIQRATLENGLRVVLNIDKSSPNVAVCVFYDVGSRNEVTGRTGFAHLFEHMMFEGSKNVGKGQHFKLITARGGTLNGTTSADRTNYFEMLPASELALGLWLEADRMKSLDVTVENVENQRAVVQEEYRMRVSNQAYAEGYIRLKALAFEGYFPYEHDPIGSMADLDAAKFEDVAAFHKDYYAPDNAVLAVAGDFDADEAMRLVREYFGDAPRRAKAPEYKPPAPPEQKARRHADLKDTNAKTPALFQAWVVPPARTPEHYALEIASIILGNGESSRLHQRLVRADGVSQSASTWTNAHRGPDLFVVRSVLTERGKLPRVQQVVEMEIQRMATEGPTAAEIDKAKTELTSHFVFALESNLHRSNELAEFELFWGDARLLSRELQNYRVVTREEVRDAVKKYLAKDRRTTVHVFPPGPEADAVLGGKAQGAQSCGGP
jgi:predicted Zn-dependent peptidase